MNNNDARDHTTLGPDPDITPGESENEYVHRAEDPGESLRAQNSGRDRSQCTTDDVIDFLGLPLFAIWRADRGVCTCLKGESCESPGKHPMFTGWQESVIRFDHPLPRSGGREENMNVGIKTGEEIFAVDADNEEAVDWLECKDGISGTRINVTSRGKQYLFKTPDFVIKNAIDVVDGVDQIDVRGRGGYIVGPGSQHVSGHEYYWENENPILDAPQWLLDLIKTRQESTERVARNIASGVVGGRHSFPTIRVGTRRNTLLYVAASLRSRGHDEDFIYSAVTDLSDNSCEEPLDKGELDGIVEFACQIEPKRDPISDEVRRRLGKLVAAYKRFLFKRPFSASDKAILFAAVDQGIALGEETPGGVKVPISRRVLAKRANLSPDTIQRRVKNVLIPKGFVDTGKDSKHPADSGFLILNLMVVDKETGEILLDTEDIDVPSKESASKEGTTFSAHNNDSVKGIVEKKESLDVPEMLFSGSEYVKELRNGAGRIGKSSGDVLDNIKESLREAGGTLSKREIATTMNLDPTNKSHMSSLHRSLQKLCAREEVIRDRYNAYKLPANLDILIEEDMREHGEFDRREKYQKKFEEDTITFRYRLELGKAARQGKDLDEVEVPKGIRKSEGIKILERQKRAKEEYDAQRQKRSKSQTKKGRFSDDTAEEVA